MLSETFRATDIGVQILKKKKKKSDFIERKSIKPMAITSPSPTTPYYISRCPWSLHIQAILEANLTNLSSFAAL